MQFKNFFVVNIRDYFDDNSSSTVGDEFLQKTLSDYSCPINADVERFLKERAVGFTKKNQSVTYFVLSLEDSAMLGYFTLTIKPITINASDFSNTLRRKLARVSEVDETGNTYTLAAYLIAQIGKNYTNNLNNRITGKELLDLAIGQVKYLQYQSGGMVSFLEAEPKEKLMQFYKDENGFRQFNIRQSVSKDNQSHTLVQMLKML